MGIPVLVIGKSGSGKSRSLKGFEKDEIALINVESKPLPFKGKFEAVRNTDDYGKINALFDKTTKNSIVVDDAGYLITNQFMRGHSSAGKGNGVFALYNDLGDSFWSLIQHAKALPDDKIVYFIMHEDESDSGSIKPKTIGKLLDEKVCIEGMFTIVIRCMKREGKHFFKTSTDGLDVTKTPEDMFESEEIDNDLKLVDTAIREYWELAPLKVQKEEDK